MEIRPAKTIDSKPNTTDCLREFEPEQIAVGISAGKHLQAVSPGSDLPVQSAIGNRAVQRLMTATLLQPKLTIGAPDDIYEKEADAVAERVTAAETAVAASSEGDGDEHRGLARKAAKQNFAQQVLLRRVPIRTLQQTFGNRALARLLQQTLPKPLNPELRCKCACGGESEEECAECRASRLALQREATADNAGSEAPPIVEDVLGTTGQPLADSARKTLEPGFGHDFSKVRVHDDSKAADSASAVNSLAYTVGNHIVFGKGQYAPGTNEGNRLLAHELTHVVQQGGVPGGPLAVDSTHKPSSEIRGEVSRSIIQRDVGSDDYNQGYQDGLSGAESNPGPRDGDALTDYNEGYAKGQYEFSQQSSFPAPADQTPAPAPSQSPAPASTGQPPAGGSDATNLDQEYATAVRMGDWQAAAEWLNGFNREDIQDRLARLSAQEVGYLHQGALDNPRVGPSSQVAQMTAPGVPAASTAPPSAAGREQHLIDLIDGNDWKGFFTEFNLMNESDQLSFLRDNFGAAARIRNHIDSADEADRDRIRYLLERATAPTSMSLYVDASVTTYRWQPKYRVGNPNDYSRFVSFGDVFDTETDINTIDDGELSEDAAEEQFQGAKPGPGGFLWPAIRNRSTLPVLWQVKQDVRRQMETLLFDDVLKAGIFVIQYLMNVVFPYVQAAAIRSLAALRGASVAGRWMQGAKVLKEPATKVLTDAEAFTQARNARNTMVEAYNQMAKAQRDQIAVVTGGVNIETGQVAGGYNTGGACAEDMVVQRLGADASKVRFSEAVRPRTGQQAPVCMRCQGKYVEAQFPEGVIFDRPGLKMPGAGE